MHARLVGPRRRQGDVKAADVDADGPVGAVKATQAGLPANGALGDVFCATAAVRVDWLQPGITLGEASEAIGRGHRVERRHL